jgi:hypothetical protein
VNAARKFVWENGLSLFFGALFFLALAGQAVAGHARYNEDLRVDGFPPVTFGRYVTSADFAVDTAENWQSEYLQFLLFIVVTVWLVQRGSAESKSLDKIGPESDRDQLLGSHTRPDSPAWARAGGWRTALYSRSFGVVMGTIFVLSWLAQSIAGASDYNEQRLRQLQDPVPWSSYVASADFWSRTLQNWQSEFLAVASMVVLAIYLRQRGSPESKPVGAPHSRTP